MWLLMTCPVLAVWWLCGVLMPRPKCLVLLVASVGGDVEWFQVSGCLARAAARQAGLDAVLYEVCVCRRVRQHGCLPLVVPHSGGCYHLWCVVPAMSTVPSGNWHCPARTYGTPWWQLGTVTSSHNSSTKLENNTSQPVLFCQLWRGVVGRCDCAKLPPG